MLENPNCSFCYRLYQAVRIHVGPLDREERFAGENQAFYFRGRERL